MRTWRPVRACQVRIPPIPGWMTRIFRRSCTRYLACKWHQTSPFPAPSIRWWDDSYFQSVLIANLAVLIIPIFIPPTSFELFIHLFYIIHFSDHIFFHPSLQSWTCFLFFLYEVYSCAWSKFKAQGKNGDEARKKALATRVQSLSPIRICHIPCMHHMCVLNYMLCLVYVVYVLNFATDKVDRGQWIHRRSSCDEVSLDWMSRF